MAFSYHKDKRPTVTVISLLGNFLFREWMNVFEFIGFDCH